MKQNQNTETPQVIPEGNDLRWAIQGYEGNSRHVAAELFYVETVTSILMNKSIK